jgi:Xaa-Pro aminopeptidase
MHQFVARERSGIACRFHRAFGRSGIATALAIVGLMFSSKASSTEVRVPESDPPLPSLTEPGQVLAPAVYRARREALMQAMGEGVAVVFGQGSEDGDGFRPNSDLFYLTGVLEENAILVLAPKERTYREFLLLPSRDPEANASRSAPRCARNTVSRKFIAPAG